MKYRSQCPLQELRHVRYAHKVTDVMAQTVEIQKPRGSALPSPRADGETKPLVCGARCNGRTTLPCHILCTASPMVIPLNGCSCTLLTYRGFDLARRQRLSHTSTATCQLTHAISQEYVKRYRRSVHARHRTHAHSLQQRPCLFQKLLLLQKRLGVDSTGAQKLPQLSDGPAVDFLAAHGHTGNHEHRYP